MGKGKGKLRETGGRHRKVPPGLWYLLAGMLGVVLALVGWAGCRWYDVSHYGWVVYSSTDESKSKNAYNILRQGGVWGIEESVTIRSPGSSTRMEYYVKIARKDYHRGLIALAEAGVDDLGWWFLGGENNFADFHVRYRSITDSAAVQMLEDELSALLVTHPLIEVAEVTIHGPAFPDGTAPCPLIAEATVTVAEGSQMEERLARTLSLLLKYSRKGQKIHDITVSDQYGNTYIGGQRRATIGTVPVLSEE